MENKELECMDHNGVLGSPEYFPGNKEQEHTLCALSLICYGRFFVKHYV